MKSRLVPVLTLALLLSLGGLAAQRHDYEARMARQEQAIALVQQQADALEKQALAARQDDARRAAARGAMASAQSIAPRYDALHRITGYEKKKTAP